MSVNFLVSWLLLISVALISGLLFSFTNAVSPGLKHLPDLEFLKAMKSINKEILNPLFLLCFFSPLLLFPAAISIQQNGGFNRWILITGFLTYLAVILITAAINVPLNNQLEKLDLFHVSYKELEVFRNRFEKQWTFWNAIRTILAIFSFLLIVSAKRSDQQ